jgi:hypothetical protein
MPVSSTVAEAVDFAEAILKHKQVSDPSRWLHKTVLRSPEYATFWWNDAIPLIEIPLLDAITRAPNGYFLVSSDRRLPPLLEYTDSGASLSHQLNSLCMPALYQAELDWRPSKYRYGTSTEIYLEFPPMDGVTHLLNASNLVISRVVEPRLVERRPEDIFDQNKVRSLWAQYAPSGPGDVPAIVLPFLTPVKYQQTCDGYGLRNAAALGIKVASSENYCAPHAIAGCVPVAWAMLLSSWKRSGFFGASKIWQDSVDWAHDWGSYGPPYDPSRSPLVENTIWTLHSRLGTTHDGASFDNNTINGATVFNDFGLGWSYGQAFDQPFEFAIRVIQAGQPLLWTAHGNWVAGEPVAGHGVVSYGYHKSDRTLFITLGWGKEVPDKYINYDQYNQSGCFFLTGHPAVAANGEEILSII